MLNVMSRKCAVAMLVVASCWGAGFVEAFAASGKEVETETETEKKDAKGTKNAGSKTVTESETRAKLTGRGAQSKATGYAESESISVTDNVTTTSTTKGKLTVSIKRLTLPDGAIVTFALNTTTIGTAKVASGRAKLSLSTKKGDTVPAVASGDSLAVIESDGSTIDLTGSFGAVKTHTETSGK